MDRHRVRVPVEPREDRSEPRKGEVEQGDLEEEIRGRRARPEALHLVEGRRPVPVVWLGVDADGLVDEDQAGARTLEAVERTPPERPHDPLDLPIEFRPLRHRGGEIRVLAELRELRSATLRGPFDPRSPPAARFEAEPTERRVDRAPQRPGEFITFGRGRTGKRRGDDLVRGDGPDLRHPSRVAFSQRSESASSPDRASSPRMRTRASAPRPSATNRRDWPSVRFARSVAQGTG